MNKVFKTNLNRDGSYEEMKKIYKALLNGASIGDEISKISEFSANKLSSNVSTQTLCPSDHIKKCEGIVNVFGLVRNNEDTLSDTFGRLSSLSFHNSLLTFKYYILENDSTDNTAHMLLNFYEKVQGVYQIRPYNRKKWGPVKDLSRTTDMAFYRNAMKNLCDEWNHSEYSIIFDTEVSFSIETFDKMKVFLDSNADVAMVTPFGVVEGTKVYYDTYALEELSDEVNKSLDEAVEVKSAFGGFIVIRTNVLQKCDWKATIKEKSEHNAFCEQVRNYGKVVVLKNVKVDWKKPDEINESYENNSKRRFLNRLRFK